MKKSFLIMAAMLGGCVALLSGCSWFHRSKPAPDRPEIIVTGIAPGAFVYVDGVQVGDAQEKSYRSRIIDVAPGNHVVEIKMGDIVTYHETAYAGPGDKRYVTVLSGNTRNQTGLAALAQAAGSPSRGVYTARLRSFSELGKTVALSGNGGASESAVAMSVGTPALDGLGFVGDGFHTDHEWIDLTSVTPRLYLFTRLLMETSRSRPENSALR